MPIAEIKPKLTEIKSVCNKLFDSWAFAITSHTMIPFVSKALPSPARSEQ